MGVSVLRHDVGLKKNTMSKDVNSRVADFKLYKLIYCFFVGAFPGVACEVVIDFLGSSNRVWSVVSTNGLACEI